MKRFIHPLLLLIAQATEKEATRYIEYLKAENKILRLRTWYGIKPPSAIE